MGVRYKDSRLNGLVSDPIFLMDCLEIIFQDAYFVAINKPAGLLVHRSDLDRYESRFALQMLRDQIGQRVYPLHRLDKPTSGVLLFALTPEAARELSPAFNDGRICKTYLTVVRGYTDTWGCIDYPLKEKLDRMTDGRAFPYKAPRSAITEFRRLATIELPLAIDRYPTARYSLLEAQPKTGRKHQIRRHMKHISHPIIGDSTHGKGDHNRLFKTRFGCDRLLLAATALTFLHPYMQTARTIVAPLDDAMMNVIQQLGWDTVVKAWTKDIFAEEPSDDSHHV